MGDSNFFMNTGSLFVILTAMIVSSLLARILSRITRCCYKVRTMRRISMFLEGFIGFKAPFYKFMYEGYLDLQLAGFMSLIAITKSESTFKSHFESVFEAICSALTLLFTGITFLMPFIIRIYI